MSRTADAGIARDAGASSGAERVAVAGAVVLAVALRVVDIGRPGYSLDEDLTYFVVEGIRHTGWPLLPSGFLYHRGIAFSYVCWAAGLLGGFTLQTYRVFTVLCGVLAVWFGARLARRVAGPWAGVAAAVGFAAAPLFVGLDSWARFYSPFLAVFLAFWILTVDVTRGRRHWAWAVALAFAGRFVSELAWACAAIPPAAWLVAPRDSAPRRQSRVLAVSTVVALAGAEIAVWALRASGIAPPFTTDRLPIEAAIGPNLVAPPLHVLRAIPAPVALVLVAALAIAGGILARRIGSRVWVGVLNGIAAGAGQFGVVTLSAVVEALVSRRHAHRALAAWLGMGLTAALALASSIAIARGLALPDLLPAVLSQGFVWPAAGVLSQFAAFPLQGIAFIVAALSRPPAGDEERQRWVASLCLVSVAWCVALGVVSTGAGGRHVQALVAMLDVVAALVAARAVGSVVARQSRAVAAIVAVVIGGAVALVAPGASRMEAAWRPPAVDGEVLRAWGAGVRAGDLVVTNDELACAYFFAEPTHWLIADSVMARRFSFARDGRRGYYAASLVVSSLDQASRGADGRERLWVAIFANGRFPPPASAWQTWRDARGGALEQVAVGPGVLLLTSP